LRSGNGIALACLAAGLLAPPLRAHADEAEAAGCPAQTFESCVQWCRDRHPGPQEREARYACFDALEPRAAAAAAAPVPAVPAVGSPTAPAQRLWMEPEGIGFLPYRQNYVLVTDTNTPNDAPTSPNPIDRVPYTYPLEHEEIKFQFSLKTLVVPSRILGQDNTVWFGYTQQSYWQAFNAAHSRPFEESDYQPEVFFSHRFDSADPAAAGWQPLLGNLGLVHQSNGQSDPRSRSWNRAYAQLGLLDRISAEQSLSVLIRPWWRFPEPASSDNNADITHYLGYGDVECLYWNGDNLLSVLARIRSVQADFSTPMLFMNRSDAKKQALQLHFQVFTGYGESLIDYNQRHTTVGVGISVPYGL
jgi:phospholipase A1